MYSIHIFRLLVLSLALVAIGCGDEDAGSRATEVAALSGNASTGTMFFGSNCATCHNADGTGIAGIGSDLTVTAAGLTDAEIAQTLISPPAGMASYAGEDNQTLANVIAHVRSLTN